MGLYSVITSAATDAQSIIAEMQGASGDVGATNFLVNGFAGIGVFGRAQVVDVPNVGGGYRKRSEVVLMATRDQFTIIPEPKQKLVRTDISPTITYLIDVVDVNDPLHVTFILVKNGQ